MKNPFNAILKASRLTKKGRPLSAILALQQFMLPAPKRQRAKRSPNPRKPVKVRRASSPRPARPLPRSFEDGRFESGYGTLSYKLYTPRGSARRRMPLVVMLHGCTQSAADFAAGTDMNNLADELGFLVLYPEQSHSANLGRCWNWHRSSDQGRGRGEPAAIAMLTLHAIAACRANPARVYIAGISAGGAAAAIVAAAYPEIYVAVGVHSGLARGAINSLGAALSAMREGASGDGPRNKSRPKPTIVFHGDRDTVVHPGNANGFLSHLQRSVPGSILSKASRGQAKGGRDFTRTLHRTSAGEVLLEVWTVHGSGHAWSGGRAAGSHTDPTGPDASREMLRFFLARRRGGKPAKAVNNGTRS